jgi:LacI family transcriptional regulator
VHLHYGREVYLGVAEHSQAGRDWDLFIFTQGKEVLEALHRLDGLVDGIMGSTVPAAARRRRVPVVSLTGTPGRARVPSVLQDNVGVGRLAAGHLAGLGLRRFVYWGPAAYPPSLDRARGFFEALAALGHRDFHAGPELDERWDIGVQAKHIARVARLEPPFGVFAFNDVRGSKLISECTKAGVVVPHDAAIVGVDNDALFCDSVRPQLSSIDANGRRVGREAAALLDRLMAGGKAPRAPTLVPPVRVVARRSTDTVATDDPLVREAVHFMRHAADRPLRVSDVALAVAVNRRRLERKFRSELGSSAHEVLTRTRIERARALLAGTEMNVKEVCAASGFTYRSHFAAVFRRATGVSPAEYRARSRSRGQAPAGSGGHPRP